MNEPRPAAPQPDDLSGDELLVAYLDGQLSANECERVEALVASDDAKRGRLQTLDRVWNALDVLPRSTASPTFTRTTIDMAAVAAKKPATARASRRFPWWTVAPLVGAVVGTLVTLAIATAPERRALGDLPVALHASALEQAGSVDFLRRLADEAPQALEPFVDDDVRDAATEWAVVAATPPPQRRAWAAALPAADVATYSGRVADFQSRPTAKQDALRRLAAELGSDPDTARLREAALAYEQMVDRLPASLQVDLRQMDADQRLRLVQREARRWATEERMRLDDGERRRFRQALEDSVADDSFVRQLEDGPTGLPPGWVERMRRRPKLAPLGMTAIVANLDRLGDRFGRADSVLEVWNGWFQPVRASLPERVQQELAAAPDDSHRARMLIGLLRDNASSDLASVFADLPTDQIDELLLLPKEEFGEALSERSVDDFDWGPPRGERGFRGGGPPGRFGPPGGPRRDGTRGGPPPFGDRPPPPR